MSYAPLIVLCKTLESSMSGELRRKEAGNVFGLGSRTPIVVTVLVKKGKETVTNCHGLRLPAADGKMRILHAQRNCLESIITDGQKKKYRMVENFHSLLCQRRTLKIDWGKVM